MTTPTAAPSLTLSLSQRLRNIASEGTSPYFCTNVPKDDLRAAADEIDALLAGRAAPSAPEAVMGELAFNAQRLRNVAKLAGLESAVPQGDATLDGARGAVLGQIARKMRERPVMDIAAMVNRFLGWQVPENLCDECSYLPSYPHRIGTHLMNADQAKAMFEYAFAAQPVAPLDADD